MKRLWQRLHEDWKSLGLYGRIAVGFVTLFLWLTFAAIPALTLAPSP